MEIRPYSGPYNFPLVEDKGNKFILRHISFDPTKDPQLFLVEQEHIKFSGKMPRTFAQGICNDPLWIAYEEEIKERNEKSSER